MKKWIIIIGIILLVLIVVGVLYDKGYLQFKWSTMSMIVAALAGPYQFIKNKFFNSNSASQLQELLENNAQAKINDIEHRKEYDAKIAEKETKIKELENQVNTLDNKLQALESEEANVSAEVKAMTSAEIEAEFEKIYGNLKDE